MNVNLKIDTTLPSNVGSVQDTNKEQVKKQELKHEVNDDKQVKKTLPSNLGKNVDTTA